MTRENKPPCGKTAGYLNTFKILFAVIPAKLVPAGSKQGAGIQKKTIWIPHLEASLRVESLRQVRNDG